MNGISASVLRIFAVLSLCSGILLCARGSYCEPLRSEVLISLGYVLYSKEISLSQPSPRFHR